MKLLLFLICSISMIVSYGQKENQPDTTKVLRQGHIISYQKDCPDCKIDEGDYFNNRKEGLWIKYHKDGKTPSIMGHYKNNRPNGEYQKFYESGQLKEKGTFIKTINTDSLIRWHPNGQLMYVSFRDSLGREQGQTSFYYENGQLEWSYFVIDGIQTNIIRLSKTGDTLPGAFEYEYSPDCKFLKTPAIKSDSLKANQKPPLITLFPPKTNGVPWNPNGYNKVYNSAGEIWIEGQFKDGQLSDGKAYFYDEDGILLNVKVYK